jgi:outer membrane protein OmpA-like peptidoglycan-associated protein
MNALKRPKTAWQAQSPWVVKNTQALHAPVVSNLLGRHSLQTKLQVDSRHDPQEQEADRVASQVVSQPWEGIIQRKCAACDEEKEHGIQAKSDNSANSSDTSSISSALLNSTGGNPLPNKINQHMSDSIGFDFSAVRVHTDGHAQQMNQYLHSRAFTYGNNVYFNQNQYQPSNSQGKHLLAHELTHVVQQNSGGQLIQKQAAPGPPSEIPLNSDVGAFWFRANENGRIEFVYGTPKMPLAGERGAGFRCEDGRCSPIISGDAGIGSLGDTYTVDEALGLLGGDDTSSAIPPIGVCLPAQRNALGFCCPGSMVANGINCEPLPEFVPTMPSGGGIPSPDGPSVAPQLGDSLRPGNSVFPTSGLMTFDNFGFNQHQVPTSAQAQISDLALRLSILSLTNTGSVLVTGYTDAVGRERANTQLGLSRAQAVKDSLIAAGAPANAFIVDSAGESSPVVETDQAEPRNRRVEIFYTFANLTSTPSFGDGFRLTAPTNFGGVEPGPF